MPSSVSCRGRRSKNEPVVVEWMVHGCSAGLDVSGVAERPEGMEERNSNVKAVGIYIVVVKLGWYLKRLWVVYTEVLKGVRSDERTQGRTVSVVPDEKYVTT